MFEVVEAQATIVGGSDDLVNWYSSGLPAGLVLDSETGAISGVPTTVSNGTALIIAATADSAAGQPDVVASIEIDWVITDPGNVVLHQINDFSTIYAETLRLSVGDGDGTRGATYTATGLPVGAIMVENIPLLTGEPIQLGDFEVEITETIDGEVTATTSFVWTVRPSLTPGFPL